METARLKYQRILKTIKVLKRIFLFFMLIPLTGMVRYFISSSSLSGRSSLRAKVVAFALVGYIVYYFIAERKKWGLNVRLVVFVIVYFLTWILGSFIKDPNVHLGLNIFSILLFSYAYMYAGSREYSAYLDNMSETEFEQIYWDEENTRSWGSLNRITVWALASIPFLGLGLLYISQTSPRLTYILAPVLVVFSSASVLIANKIAVVNVTASLKHLLTKKKK